MRTRRERLKKLGKVQEQLKALHQTRHAGFVAKAAAAGQEASDLMAHFDAAHSVSGLFPDVYHRRIDQALAREQENREMARSEAERVATATARTNMVERSYRDERRQDDRAKGDRERLEMIEQLRGRRAGDK